MKNIFIKAMAGLLLATSAVSCGDKFLDTKIYNGIDLDTGLNSVSNIGNALNGCYYRLFTYYFAGNYATMIGDIGSDLSYWNTKTSHFNDINQFTYQPTTSYLTNIWNYGYKVIDNSSRVIKACNELSENATASEKEELSLYKAEALSLRAYATLVLTNIFGHQIKVNGQDFSNELGVVTVDEPIQAYAEVERATVGACYAAIVKDLTDAIALYNAVGDNQDLFVFGKASACGLLARTYTYMENWAGARQAAADALAESGITSLTYSPTAYKALFNGGASNVESMFALAITNSTNWSANSCGTLFSSYGYTPTPYLLSLYGENDCRRSIISITVDDANIPTYGAGKFGAYAYGNPAYATNYLINAPEMFLIQAEAYLNEGNVTEAQKALFVVAHRNPDIAAATDLPSDAAGLKTFLMEERARELFQEGHRLWDLRRWNKTTGLAAVEYPAIKWLIQPTQLGDFVFPIPEAEINAGFGVVQTPSWESVRPQ